MQWLVKTLTIISIFYLVLVASMFFLQRKLQYFPHVPLGTLASYGVTGFSEVSLKTSDGLTLRAWYAPAQKGKLSLVHFHGNGGNISHRVPSVFGFHKQGYGVLLVEYRGFGGNLGNVSETGFYADGRAALSFMAGKGVKAENIVIMGESLGTGTATQMALEYPVRGLILEAPFTTAADVGQRAYPFLPVRLLIWDRYDNAAKIAGIKAPLLIVHGDHDRTVPFRLGERLFRMAVAPKKFHRVVGGGHGGLHNMGALEVELEFIKGLK